MRKKLSFRVLFFISILFAIIGFGLVNLSLTPSGQAQTNREITSNKNSELNVTIAFWEQQQKKALEERKSPTGDRPTGLVVPDILAPGNVARQKAKQAETIENGFTQPFDFADLALKRMSGEFVELPIATQSYLLDVGGSADEGEFTTFEFEKGSVALNPLSSKYKILKKLADDFDGMKYDLQNSRDRRQMKVRLLRMITPQTKIVLEEIAQAYLKEFNRPLRITAMTRSIEYQIKLNSTNANSFVVRGKGSLPPHVSGYAFDIGRRTLTADEQNFIIKKLVEMEGSGKIDALVEYGATAAFHIFVYWDGKPPKI